MSLIIDALKKLQTSAADNRKISSVIYQRFADDISNGPKKIVTYSVIVILLSLAIASGLWLFKATKQLTTYPVHQKPLVTVPEKQPILKSEKKSEPKVIPAITISPVKNDTKTEANQLFYDATMDVKSAQFPIAINKLQRAIELLPSFNKARELLIVLLIQENKLDSANNILKDGLMIAPSYIPFIQIEAQLLMKEQKYEGAIRLLNEFSPDVREYPDFYTLKASLDEIVGDYNNAVFIYSNLLRGNPQDGTLWLGLGIAYQEEDKTDEANNAFERALSFGGLNESQQLFVKEQLGYH